MSSKGKFKVGNCLIEQDLDRISNGTQAVTVRPQVMDVLVYLAIRKGRTVHADDLLENLWPGKVVTNASVYNCINELRRAFLSCDDGQPYIETIPKKGYRLVAPVIELDVRSADASQKDSRLSKRWLAIFVFTALAAAVLFLLRDQWSISESQTPSIAVLPFANLSPDPDQEHFADGLAEELLNSLAAIGELRVISRNSSFAFKDRNTSTADIAAALQVDHILDGSVRRAGDTVRVTAQLINTSTDSSIWSHSYDRDLNVDNVLDIQNEIATRVVAALNLRLLPQESAMLISEEPANLRALDLFHDGMFYLNKIKNGQSLSKATFDLATTKFREAITADPNWAPPYAALGRTYHFRIGNLDGPDSAEVLRKSTRYLMQAIDLDEDYGPAYGSLGFILATSGDYGGAMRAFDRARALNVDASWGRAILMMGLGRHDEAIDEYRNAADLNPLSTSIKTQLAAAYMCAGRFADAITTIEDDDGIFVNESVIADRKLLLSESYSRAGDKEKGLQIAYEVADQTGESLYVAYLFALAGERQRARSILSSREITGMDAFLDASSAWGVVDDKNKAFTMLQRAVASARSASQPLWVLETVNCVPELKRLSSNPRFETLLDSLGLPN